MTESGILIFSHVQSLGLTIVRNAQLDDPISAVRSTVHLTVGVREEYFRVQVHSKYTLGGAVLQGRALIKYFGQARR